MVSDLLRTETAVEACRAHLTDAAAAGTPIDAYLSRYLAVILCAELEETIRELVHTRVQQQSSADVLALVLKVARNIVRSADHQEVRDVIGYFGKPYGDRYVTEILATAQESGVEALNNLVKARNDIAHRTPPNLTLSEIETALVAGKHVLAAVRKALEVA
ncbi:MAG: HEPN domain-containing protein [Dehalococcoidia bacterium]|nr:HEPN domain-containing protein [Dehalococcoidia bacterium]